MNPYLRKLFISLLIPFLFLQCDTQAKEDTSSAALLFAGIASNCSSINDCFDRYAKTTDEGASLQIFDSTGARIYARQSILNYDTYKAIASGSKWVTAVTAMRAIDCTAGTASSCGTLTANKCQAAGTNISLSTTTASALGWTGTKGTITLRQLLAFTSGLNAPGGNGAGQAACIATLPASEAEKDACAVSIRDTSTGTPGLVFQYNSNHMAIAQRILEKTCGLSWAQIFSAAIVTPLGWDASQALWRGNFTSSTAASTDGSLSGAYGLSISSEHYARMMQALLRNGIAKSATADVSNFLSTSSIAEILNDQYQGATIGYSQFSAFGYRWQYGLGNWRYCTATTVPAECDKDLISHSIGINGFYPWIDLNKGYMAVLAVNNLGVKNGLNLLPPSSTSLFFSETIRPFIHTLIGK
jgi:hypothetical protein